MAPQAQNPDRNPQPAVDNICQQPTAELVTAIEKGSDSARTGIPASRSDQCPLTEPGRSGDCRPAKLVVIL